MHAGERSSESGRVSLRHGGGDQGSRGRASDLPGLVPHLNISRGWWWFAEGCVYTWELNILLSTKKR